MCMCLNGVNLKTPKKLAKLTSALRAHVLALLINIS